MDANRARTSAAVAPYAAWMALMALLPVSAFHCAYAVRSAVSGLLLAVSLFILAPCAPRLSPRRLSASLFAGLAAGFAVFVLWTVPELAFPRYGEWFVLGSVSDDARIPEGVSAFTIAARIAGSAFVIAPAEELFFRFFLYRRLQSPRWTEIPVSRFDLQAFLWTTGLFALEHNRLAAGALAGAAYSFVSMRFGTRAAIVAHISTNLFLGVFTVSTGTWRFW